MSPRSGAAVVNDVHARLNPTRVACVEQPGSPEEICRLIRAAVRTGLPVSICGGRHAMGGQQFGTDTLLLDLSRCTRILELDRARGFVRVEAGIRWPELIAGLHARQAEPSHATLWSIRQKQTGADQLSLGGALAANIHGRGLRHRPIVADVEAFTLVDARGEAHACSRRENADLFRLAVGGYGVFGVVTEVTLRLVPRRRLRRRVEILHAEDLPAAFEARIAAGDEYGDFQFSTDESAPDFLRRGVFSCYQPVPDDHPEPGQPHRTLAAEDWRRLLGLAHTDRRQAFADYCRHYLATDGQLYWSDTHQLGTYVEGYHDEIDRQPGVRCPGSEMITELYVPRPALPTFLTRAAELLRRRAVVVIYGTVRLIERDGESFLAWAREPFACIIFNLHVDHRPAAVEHAAQTFRALIDLAASLGGSFYLTYHRWASRAQMEACYPQFADFLSLQRQHDPAGRWQSDWLRHCQRLFS